MLLQFCNEINMQSRRLSTLIAVIDHLERRLYGGAQPDDEILTDKELLDFLQSIGRQYANTIASSSNTDELQQLQLEDELKHYLATKPHKSILSIRHIKLLQFTEVLFRCIDTSSDVHIHVYTALQGLQLGFIKTLINEPAALLRFDEPYRSFLEFLINAFRGYDQHSGRRARTMVNEAGRRVAEILLAQNDIETCKIAKQSFSELLQRYNRESTIYEKSLITKEQGLAARDDVRLLVNREILIAVGGKRLPADLLRFFKEVWSKYLQVTYLRDGKDSNVWQQGVSVIQTIVRSLYIQDPYEMLQFYQNDLAHALAILHSGAESIHQDLQLTRNVLAYLDELPLQLIQKGKKVDVSNFQEVPLAGQSEHSHINADLNPDDIKALEKLTIGDWYIVHIGEQIIRGKLIQKDIHLGYCLFANFSGIKAARIEIAGIAQALVNGTLIKIDTTLIMERALETAVTQLEAQVQKLESKVHVVEQERANVLIKNSKLSSPPLASIASVIPKISTQSTEETQHIKQLQENIRQEEMAALEQKRKLAEEQALARDLAQRQENEKALEKALKEVNMLQPGGWLELISKDNIKHVCKLGLKLKSTQKMIFVDRFGQKIAEMRPDELAARIVEGSARVIDHGIAFEDTLQSLIIDRSGKINVE